MKFIKAHNTLDKILEITKHKQRGFYLRIGYNDIHLAYGQKGEKIKKECQELLRLNDQNIIKTFPAECPKYGIEDWWGVPVGIQNNTFNTENQTKFVEKLVNMSVPFWNSLKNPNTPVYSRNAFWITACYDLIFWLKFLKEFRQQFENVIYIGNENVTKDILNLIWGNRLLENNFVYIELPTYSNIDDVEKEFNESINNISINNYTLVVLESGPSGRCLGKRIYKSDEYKNRKLFLFDFGSMMDALHNRKTREWIKKESINLKSIFEELRKLEKE
jgi:hypothetical protein